MAQLSGWTPRRIAWTVAGAVTLGVGAIGAVLPILPTTPFVIAAAFAFGKGSPSLARWLEENPLYGPIIADWRQSGAIAPRFKAVALTMMAVVFAVSIAISAPIVVLIVQAGAMGAAAIFILTRPNRAG